MSRRSAILMAAFTAVIFAFPACKKAKPTAADTPPPPGGLGGPPMPGGTGMPGQKGMPGAPGDQHSAQPNDPSLPMPPRAPGLTMNALTRLKSQNNLKQIGLAFHNFADTYGGSFPEGFADKSKKVGLSWRVAILPYIEQDTLYKQFKLDEPWDSEHNKKLIQHMPKLLAPPDVDTNGYTWYRSFTGPDTIMPPATAMPGQPVPGVKLFGIPDGASYTFMVVEATDPVIWTKPDELPYEKGKPLPKMGGSVFKEGFNAAMCDGRAIFVKGTTDATTLGNAINRQDGNPVKFDD